MHIDFTGLTTGPEILKPEEIQAQLTELLGELCRADVDKGLINWVGDLVGWAEESGYKGGYSDAHWYARGMED